MNGGLQVSGRGKTPVKALENCLNATDEAKSPATTYVCRPSF
jgi:hypothetical protein